MLRIGSRWVIILVGVVLLLACGTKMPSERLVGHWQNEDGTHIYFGKLDEKGEGTITTVTTKGDIQRSTYVLKSENPNERVVVIVDPSVTYGDLGPMKFTLASDYKSAGLALGGDDYATALQRVDSKTEP